MKSKKLEIILLISILTFALALKIAYLLKVPSDPLGWDSLCYDTMTKQLLDKGFYAYAQNVPNAYTTPGYPIFLAIMYKIFGYTSELSPLDAVRMLQIFLSVATIYFLYLVGKLLVNGRVGLMAAFFASIYLVGIWVPTTILTESLYTFFFILYLYVQLLALKRQKWGLHAAAGALLALAVLVRPLIAPLIVLPYVYDYWFNRDKAVFKYFLFNFGSFIAVMMPWWIRNLIVLKKFVPFATQADPLLRGTYPYGEGVENMPLPPENQNAAAIERLKEGFSHQFWLYLKWYTIGKFDWLYLKVYYYARESEMFLRWLMNLHYLYVFAGWFVIVRSFFKREMLLLSLYVVLLTGANMVFVATSRYSYPVMYILILFTAYAAELVLFGKTKKISQ